MKKYTYIFILSVLVSIFIFDVVIILIFGKDASISNVLIEWSYLYPSTSFLMGFVMGHLYWRMKPTKTLRKIDEK